MVLYFTHINSYSFFSIEKVFTLSDSEAKYRNNHTAAGISFGKGANISSNGINAGSVIGEARTFSASSVGNSNGDSSRVTNLMGGNYFANKTFRCCKNTTKIHILLRYQD